MASSRTEEKCYISLKDFRMELEDSVKEANGAFSLCFWLYIENLGPSVTCPILFQELPNKSSSLPFLVLNEKKQLMLFPLFLLYEEALLPTSSDHYVSAEADFSTNKWVHVGCQVSQKDLSLHLNGKIAGEKSSASSPQTGLKLDATKTVLPRIIGDNDGSQGFIYGAEVLSPKFSLQNHHLKDPPLQLSIDTPSAVEIEEESDGVWSIVGGKASCRRNFSLDAILLDALSQPVDSELEVVASLLYDDTYAPVEKIDDAEAPLLVIYDGIEYASNDRPIKLVRGCANFKLRISQLSSKSDNRLFCIKFEIPNFGRYPFVEVFSRPIRCISRGRNVRTSSVSGKQSPSGVNKSHEFPHNVVCEAKQSPLSKRVKLGQERLIAIFNDAILSKQTDEDFSTHTRNTTEANNTTNMARRPENHEQSDNHSSGSVNGEATNSVCNTMVNNRLQVSDMVAFKYCLGNLPERSLLIKELVSLAREDEIANFADQVAMFSGCSHHRLPILISKRLLEEGAKVWDSISLHNHHVLWEKMASGIKEYFMKIVPCSTRSLTSQDLQLLWKISGCQELVSKEKFEQIWCWLYPVAFMLSQAWMIGLWATMSPKWIEGFITKEEAEYSLLRPGYSQDPGTFILRFPTSRSWPHPDAGNLVVTYVGNDHTIHHRLLSMDFIHSAYSRRFISLQQMLLEEPELSRLGSVSRTH